MPDVANQFSLLVALRWERVAVQAAVRQARRVREVPGRMWQVTSAQRTLSIVETGMGLEAAESTARWLVARQPGTPLVMLGCAGGLHPEVAALDTVIPERVCSWDEQFTCDVRWRERLQAAADAACLARHGGVILSVPEPLVTVASKRQAAVRSGATAVDMESAAVARVAARAGSAFAVARVILDDASTEIPSTLAALATLPLAGTAVTLTRLATALVRQF